MSSNVLFFRLPVSYCALLLTVVGAVTACSPGEGNLALPEPPSILLEGFDPTARAQIVTAQQNWQASPRSAEANGQLAMLLHAYGQSAWAATYYQRAGLLNASDFRWPYLRALVLAKEGRRHEAQAALRGALSLRADYLPARLKLASMLADAGQVEESREIYENLLASNPGVTQVLYGLGRLRLQAGDESGLGLLELAAKTDSAYGAAHYALAGAYRKRGDSTRADAHLELFERRKKREPPLQDPLLDSVKDLSQSQIGHVNRAIRLLNKGNFRDAAQEFEAALEKDPADVSAHIMLIAVYGAMNRISEAESHYQQALALDPDWVRLHFNFGVLRMKQKRFEEAATAFRAAIAVDDEYADAYVNLGIALGATGEQDEAMASYRMALARDPGSRRARFFLASALMQRNDFFGAAELLEKVVETEDRQTPEYLRVLAKAYEGSDDLIQSEAALLRAIDLAGVTRRTDLLPGLNQDLLHVRALINSRSGKQPE